MFLEIEDHGMDILCTRKTMYTFCDHNFITGYETVLVSSQIAHTLGGDNATKFYINITKFQVWGCECY